jgi:hypothetical protein
VATGDLKARTGNDTCVVSASVCLPLACKLQQITSGQTW